MPTTHDHFVQVARSVRRDLDRDAKAFMTVDRMELTRRLREASGTNTRIKTAGSAVELEDALSDQGLRCYPSLTATTTGDQIRIFRAGSAVGDLIDAVLTPSPDHDRQLSEALAKYKGTWDWNRTQGMASTAEVLRKALPREKQLEYVRSLEDPDLATT